MSRYLIGDAATGEITRPVVCEPRLAPAMPRPGELIAESSDASAATHWMRPGEPVQVSLPYSAEMIELPVGELVPYTPEQLTAKAARPHPMATWDNRTMAWSDPRALDELREEKWTEIREARNTSEKAGFPYLGKILQSDEIAVLRMTVAESAARKAKTEGLPYANVWTCADDSLLPLDADQQIGMLPALAAYGMQLHQHAQQLRAQIYDPATTAEDLETIQWPF